MSLETIFFRERYFCLRGSYRRKRFYFCKKYDYTRNNMFSAWDCILLKCSFERVRIFQTIVSSSSFIHSRVSSNLKWHFLLLSLIITCNYDNNRVLNVILEIVGGIVIFLTLSSYSTLTYSILRY